MKISADIPDELARELERRAKTEDRSASSLVRLAVRELLFGASDGAILGRGWKLEEDWRGLWAVREKAPGLFERVCLEEGPAAVEERPMASMSLHFPGDPNGSEPA